MRTHPDTLLHWLDEPAAERGLHFAQPGDDWDFRPYTELAHESLRFAGACVGRRVPPGGIVVLVQRCSPTFVAGMFGAVAAGATVCPIAPPFAYQRADDYERHLGHTLAVARPELIVADEDALDHVRPVAERLGLAAPVSHKELVTAVDPLPAPRPAAETALVQFTSGSSGWSRGVRIAPAALEANVAAMRRWLLWEPADPGINWLPVHHDMGLIGGLMNIMLNRCDGWMLQPDDFIRDPRRYLACISDHGARISPMPNFGLAYILRRVRPQHLEGLRFDSLRAIVVGAERVDPSVLTAFHALLGPFGLDRRALVPAYGAAEATLAITGVPVTEGWTAALPDGASPQTGALVGCGRPLEGVSVRVVDEENQPVGDGVIGEIVVGAPSLASGYLGEAGTASGTSVGGGVLRTGDAGFWRDGQLFVLGRLGDGLKVRGRMVFAESLEARMVELGIPERRVAVLLGARAGRPTGAVVLAAPEPGWPQIAHRVLAEHLEDADLVQVAVPRGGLAVTSSGKPRRRVLWKALCDGTLAGETGPLHAPDPAVADPGVADRPAADLAAPAPLRP